MKFYAALLSLIFATVVGPFVDDAFAQNRILVTPTNQHLFLFLGGKLDLACHRPVGASQTLHGEMERVTNPDGTITRTFVVRTEAEVKKLQSKYALQIKNLLKQLKLARGRDARRSVINSIRAKIKARQALHKEARAAVIGCGPFAPGGSYTPRAQTPDDFDSDPDDMEIGVENNPFPGLPENVDSSVRLDPGPESLVFYVSCNGNDTGHGLNPENAVRTFARAFSLLQQASGATYTDHHIRLERGCSYADRILVTSGRNRDTPYVVGDYGSMTLPAPLMTEPFVIDGPYRNIAISGLHFYNAARDPDSPSFNPGSPNLAAITIKGATKRILVQRSSFEFYTTGIHIEGRSSRVAELATRMASIANNFVDLYNLGDGTSGPGSGVLGYTNGIFAKNVRGLNVKLSNFVRIGNPRRLSSEQGNTGATGLPVVVPAFDAMGVRVETLADSYILVQGNQFIQGVNAIFMRGYTTDQFGQLAPTTGEVYVNDNLFYEMYSAIGSIVPSITAYRNAIVRSTRRGNTAYVRGFEIWNSSAVDIHNNVFMNSLSDLQGRDRAIDVRGYANFAYHKVNENKIYNFPGGLIIGPLQWYTGIMVEGLFGMGNRWVPLNHKPQSIVYSRNIIQDNISTFPVVEVQQQGQQAISEVLFRGNQFYNPNIVDNKLWLASERSTTTAVNKVYEEIPIWCGLPHFGWNPDLTCQTNPTHECCPRCLYQIISRADPLRIPDPGYYATRGAGFRQQADPSLGIPFSDYLPVLDSTGYSNPDSVTTECNDTVQVGAAHYVSFRMNQTHWRQYVNRYGGDVNELAASDPDASRIEQVNFVDPDRDLVTFMATNNIQIRDANGLRPATTVDDYIEYLTDFVRHAPNEDTSVDPRVLGPRVANYFRVGLNVVAP